MAMTTRTRLNMAIAAAIVVYLAADAGFSVVLEPLDLEHLHAFLAMFCGMLVGGFLAGRNFVWIAVALNLGFSALTYVAVARMRQQSIVELVAEQHLMISVGSFAGAILGAWLGRGLASLNSRRTTAD